MKILPFNQKQKKFHNWSNYLNWIDYEITSIQDYLNNFNQNFRIKNQALNVINSKNWTEDKQPPSVNSFNFYTENDIKYFLPYELRFREGVFIPEEGIFMYMGDINGSQTLDQSLLKPIESGKVVFAKKSGLNMSTASWDDFLIISQPMGGFYLPQSGANNISFSFVADGFSKFGSMLLFSVENIPGRYFITNESNSLWVHNSTQWGLSAAYWSTPNSSAQINICNSSGGIWTNSYPILHETVVVSDDSSVEHVFLDSSFKTQEIKISSHLTTQYSINRENAIQFPMKIWII